MKRSKPCLTLLPLFSWPTRVTTNNFDPIGMWLATVSPDLFCFKAFWAPASEPWRANYVERSKRMKVMH